MLLNPPMVGQGVRTRNAVAKVAAVLGYEEVKIANLCAVATKSVVEIGTLGRDAWTSARGDLETALWDGGDVLAGWGVAGLSGDARRWKDAQIAWLNHLAQAKNVSSYWMVGGEPRHPSRWHQYVSDKYGRTSGGTFEERIAQVVVQVPVTTSLRRDPPEACG